MVTKPMMAQSKSSNRGVTLSPRNDNFPFLQEAGLKTSVKYAIELPFIRVFALDNQYPECVDMPIKLSGHETYFLPEEWSRLTPILDQIIGFEHSHNSQWRDYIAYLSVTNYPVKTSESTLLDEISCGSKNARQYSLTVFDQIQDDALATTKNVVTFNKFNYSFEGVESAGNCKMRIDLKFSKNKINGKNKTYNSMLNYK